MTYSKEQKRELILTKIAQIKKKMARAEDLSKCSDLELQLKNIENGS